MNITKHIVTSANWDTGRNGNIISGVVLHTMVGYMQGSESTFNDPTNQVSVHYGIGMDGSIRQWVEEANTAWQAGNYSVNLKTIGIEHEDFAKPNDSVRTDALYESSSDLVADICRRYNFPADANHIFLHKDVIDKIRYPGGTNCPDGLDTNRIISMAAQKINQGGSVTHPTQDQIVAAFSQFKVPGPNAKQVSDYQRGDMWELYRDCGLWAQAALTGQRDDVVKQLQAAQAQAHVVLNKQTVIQYVTANLK